MKKTVISIIGIVLMLFAITACQPRYIFWPLPDGNQDEPIANPIYTVTYDYGYEGSTNKVLSNQAYLLKPVDPTREGTDRLSYEFEGWLLNGNIVTDSQWNQPLTGDVILTASWITVAETFDDIPEIKAFLSDNTSQSSQRFGFLTASAINYDGQDKVRINDWTDIKAGHNVTIKNVEFMNGLSITVNEKSNPITITIESCVIHGCDQKALIDATKSVHESITNSGDGLCLNIDTSQDSADVTVICKGNTLIGSIPGRGDFETEKYSSYKNWNHVDGTTPYEKMKGRGNGISLGGIAGNSNKITSATISGNTFEGMFNAALQLYTFTAQITVENNTFKSWGMNSTDGNNFGTYAIRGDIPSSSQGDSSLLTLRDNTYASSMPGLNGTTINLSSYKVAINYWNNLDENNKTFDQSKAD